MIQTGFNFGFRGVIIAVGICATSFVATKKSDSNFNYGYWRVEIIAVFAACTCQYILALYSCVEEIHHIMMSTDESERSHSMHRRYDMTALTLKLISEVYVILKLWHWIDWKANKSAREENLTVMVIHILIMAISDGMQIISRHIYSMDSAFPIIEVVCSLLTLLLLRPFFVSSAKILL